MFSIFLLNNPVFATEASQNTSIVNRAVPVAVSDFEELKAAVAAIPADGTTYTIEITKDITMGNTPIMVNENKNIIFKSANASSVILTTSVANIRHFQIYSNGDTTWEFENVVLDGKDIGGGITVTAPKMVFNKLIIKNCTNQFFGGGMYVAPSNKGSVYIKNSEISHCVTPQKGGGIFAYTKLFLENTSLHDNVSQTGHGGALYSAGIDLDVKNCTIYNNQSQTNGGGLQIENGNANIVGTTLKGNIGGYGGAIAIGQYSPEFGTDYADFILTIADSKILDNTANGNSVEHGPLGLGGAIIVNSTRVSLKISNTEIKENNAYLTGGAIYTKNLANLHTDTVTFSNNSSSAAFDWLLDKGSTNETIKKASIIHEQNIINTTYTTPFSNVYSDFDVNFSLYYTVTFDSQGGSLVEALQCKPKDTIINHQITPNRLGYEFVGWYKNAKCTEDAKWDFDKDIVDFDITLYAKWEPRTDLAYRVEHYLEDTNGKYKVVEVETLQGTNKQTVFASPKDYVGYTFNDQIKGTINSGVVTADETLVLKLYYSKNDNQNITFITSTAKRPTKGRRVNTSDITNIILYFGAITIALGGGFIMRKKQTKSNL